MSFNYRHVLEVWTSAADAMVSPPKGVYLPWWPTLSDFIGGMRKHELTLLCAPTGAGKTQLLANLSAQLLIQNVPHFVAPVETGDTDFLIRVVSCLEGKDLNTGDPVPADLVEKLFKKYSGSILSRGLYIAEYDNRVDIHELITMLKYMNQQYGCTVALLDNLNFFLKVVSAQQERMEMDSAVHEFVMLAKKIPMHIILIVHPKKTDGGRVLSEFDIKGSSTAVQEASNVLLFNRPSQEQIEEGAEPSDRELVFRKIRKRGMNVGRPIWFAFNKGRYEELRK